MKLTVLYRDSEYDDQPSVFVVDQADDFKHAEEQCKNAYPGCDILWISTADPIEANREFEQYLYDSTGDPYWDEV